MTPPSTRSKTVLFHLVLAWMAAGLLLAFFWDAMWGALWLLALPVLGLHAVLGLVLAGFSLWRALQERSPRRASEAVIVVVFGGALALCFRPLALAGDAAVFNWRFSSLRERYEAIAIQAARELASPGDQHWPLRTRAGIRYIVDSGPPVRVAFLQPGGILDNWEGVVHDPTDRVRSATGWRDGVPGQYSADVSVVELFGGDLVGCKPVRDHFYRCWFT